MLFLVLISAVSVQAKDVYGFMTGNSSEGEIPIGMYKYNTDGGTPELMTSLMYSFWGGTFADGRYMMILSDDASGYLTEGLCTYDLNTKDLTLRYSQQPYQCSDLTYDYSTSSLYGVMIKSGGEDVTPRLIKINTADGSYTKVAQLNIKIVALACTYYGDMYAMDGNSNLYELDKVTGELSLVGNTGVKCSATEAQSMEFDRSTGELYWTGLDENYYTFFNKINPKTAKVEVSNSVENNSLIVGLYIPFTIADGKAPAKPLNLSAISGDAGVTLTWTNPAVSFDGGTSDVSLTKVEIYRNGQLIHTIENPVAGKEESYVDDAKDLNGKVRYIVYAYNEVGRGEGASVKLMTGEDAPSVIENLTCRKNDSEVLLTWTAPTTGKNGGSIKPENLTYTVERQPDGKLFDNIKETQFADNTITAPCYYTWQVVCKNTVGESEPVKTQPLAAGESLSVPYTADFDSDLGCAQWLAVDHNNDGNTWQKNTNGYVYNTSYTNAADDSLVSVPFHLEKNVRYVVNYDILAPDVLSSEHFELSLLGNNGKQVIEDLNNFTTPDFSTPESRKAEFTVPESGEYRFCLAALSEAGQFMIQISSFSVEAEHDIDLAVERLAVSASQNIVEGSKAKFEVTVRNKGLKDVGSYILKLTDDNDKTVASKTVNDLLKSNETAVVTLDYAPQAIGSFTLNAVVEAEGDEVTQNDKLSTNFYALGDKESVVAVGGKDCLTDYPFWFNGAEYNYCQAIYLSDEINHEKGDITELDYDYINSGKELKDKHIKVYLANTQKDYVTEGWMPEQQMELAFDGNVSFLEGENTLRLRLPKPFEYTGGNLCVMTVKEDTEKTEDLSFYAAYSDEVCTALYHGAIPFVDSNVQGAQRINYLGIVIKPSSVSSVSGIASDDDLSLTRTGNIFALANGGNAKFTVADIAGNIVQIKDNANMISLSSLREGVYVLTVEANGKTKIMKVAM